MNRTRCHSGPNMGPCKFSGPMEFMGLCILLGPLPPLGSMLSRHLSQSHGPETVTETETLLRVIEISKHKINIINEEKYLWACLETHWDPEF